MAQQVEVRLTAVRAQRDRDLPQGLRAAYLQDLAEQEAWLKIALESLRGRLRDLESKRLEQLAKFQQAHRDREVLSEIREQKHQVYEHEQLRQEQKMLDDVFLSQMRNSK